MDSEIISANRENAEPGSFPPVELEPDIWTDRLISVGLWGLGLTWMIPTMSLQMALTPFTGSRRIHWIACWYTRVQIALTGNRWRTVVHPEIDPARSYMFVQNHTNHLDYCAMYNATPHFKQGVELEDHFRYPMYGWFMKQRGTIPVRRGSREGKERMIEMMRSELARGNSLLVFPEGTRTIDGRLGRFKSGMFHVARQLQAPIVPVTVTGMYQMMRKGSYRIHPGHEITVYCDRPIPTAQLKAEDIPELMKRVHAIMSDRLNAYWAVRAACATHKVGCKVRSKYSE